MSPNASVISAKDEASSQPLLETSEESNENGTDRQLVRSRHGDTFLIDNSLDPYQAYQEPHTCAVKVNRSLNLHLGLPFNPRKVQSIRKVCRLLSQLLLFVENYLFAFWDKVPLRLRQVITMKAWSLYLPLHKLTLSNKTAIHPDASAEYHALTTIMYWGRLFPVTIKRMRFSLSQLPVWHAPDVYPILKNVDKMNGSIYHVEEVIHDIHPESCTLLSVLTQKESDRPVQGYYIHGCSRNEGDKKVLFYLFGGAYLSGDAQGNIQFATKLAQRCDIDVFIPQYRLLPEYNFFDSFEDTIRAYSYLIQERGVKPENVTLFGISSGGGLSVRLLQQIAEVQQKSSGSIVQPGLLQMPSGAVLLSPFVDYTTPKGSFKEYIAHDLIVNESVFEEGIPYLRTLGDDDARHRESPVNRSFANMPPLCLLVSEHECCYEQNIELVNNARNAGVEVDLAVWKYMCHVWIVLSAFLPEARSAVDFASDWIVKNTSSSGGYPIK